MRALVVEDHPGLRDELAGALRRRGHTVAAFGDAEAAWLAWQEDAAPLLVVDWLLPGMDGLELCARVRAHPLGHGCVVLVITGRDAPDNLARTLTAGADDFLVKPFSAELLDARFAFAERRIEEGRARARSEAARRASALDYRRLFELANDAIVVFAPEDERVLDVNRRACQLYGVEREAFVGRSLREFSVAPERSARYLTELVETGEQQRFETIQRRDGGAELHLAISASVINFGGRPAVLSINRDVTERRRSDERLRDSERQLRAALEAGERHSRERALLDEVRTALERELELPDIFRTVVDGIANSLGYSMVSLYLLEDGLLLLQHQVGYHQTVDRIPADRGVMGRVARTGVPALIEDGAGDPEFIAAFPGIVSEVCVPLRDDGAVVGVLNLETSGGASLGEADLRLMQALSQHVNIAIGRARLHAAARASDEQFRRAFDHAAIGMSLVGLDGRWLKVNRALCAIVGYPEAELLTMTFGDITHPDDLDADLDLVRRTIAGERDSFQIEKRYLHRDGRVIWIALSVAMLRDERGRPRCFISQVQDITGRKELEARYRHLALHDPLTALPNRALFSERLERALAEPDRAADGLAVLFVDLDGFKLVNDGLGHAAGDRLLVAAGERLVTCVRDVDTVARLGGDEFAVLLWGIAGRREAIAVAERMLAAITPPFVVEGREAYVTASIGVAMAGAEERRPGHLLRNADIALYEAKAAGRASFAVYQPRMAAPVLAQMEQEGDLRRAMGRQELRVRYQPQIHLASGRFRAAEALVRWEHPSHGLLPPARFIELAERTGLIVPLGAWVLAEACGAARRWPAGWAGPHEDGPSVGVNLSVRQFLEPGLVAAITGMLRHAGLPPHRLELEVTESVLLVEGSHARRTMAELKSHGIRLAIDDFGVGYSSLRYLRDLAVDVVKIDRSFVAGLGTDAASFAIVRAVTNLAHDLGLTVTAEGIETAAQLATLRDLGVDHGQGYLFAPPLTEADLARFAADRTTGPMVAGSKNGVGNREPVAAAGRRVG